MRKASGGIALLIAALLVLGPATASADTPHFYGRSGTHRELTWVPNWGLRPYRIAGSVSANIYGRAHGSVAKAAFGIYYSTAALSPDTVLEYGFEYRKRGGKWRAVCLHHLCLFDSRKQASWPGQPGGGQYFHADLPIARPRNIQEVKLIVAALTENGAGRHVGLHHSYTFRVKYSTCNCVLPSGVAPEPAPAPEPPPAQPPAPAPAPAPVPRDICAAHPSDPSVVCVRNQGHTVDVCDRDPDGHRAYARVVTDASSPNFQSPYYDDNDSQAGCANLSFPSSVRSVAVCVQYEGCSALKPT